MIELPDPDRMTFRTASPGRPPKMWAHRNMRRLLWSIAFVAAVNIVAELFTPNPLLAVTATLGYVWALVSASFGYYHGTREHQVIGRWMAYPVDADGTPSGIPITGQLLVDEPERRK